MWNDSEFNIKIKHVMFLIQPWPFKYFGQFKNILCYFYALLDIESTKTMNNKQCTTFQVI